MAGFSSYDDLINEITVNGKIYEWFFHKIGSAPEAAGVWHTLWKAAGIPGAGADAAGTPGDALDDVAGSMFFPDQASDTKHLISVGALANQSLTLMIYDRLVSVGGVSINSTGDKTINSPTLPRYTDGVGVLPIIEVTTVTAAAAVVSVNSYTNTADQTGRAGGSVTFPSAITNVDTMFFLPLQAGDKGVKAISTINASSTGGGSAAVAVSLVKPLVFLPILASYWTERDLVLQMTSLPRIYDGASLGLAYLASTTNVANVFGHLRVAYG